MAESMSSVASTAQLLKAIAAGILLACSCPLPAAATEETTKPVPARIDLLPPDYTAMRFRSAPLSGFHQRPERFAFFGYVRAAAGCDKLRRLAASVAPLNATPALSAPWPARSRWRPQSCSRRG